VKFHVMARVAFVFAVAVLFVPRPAHARNPHCAGGIQYVVGGLRDNEKGLTEDYVRQMNKAVQQLEMCATEDPADFEAIGYLGWAYAELDSAGPAGRAFQKSIEGLTAKGDKKKAEWATQNRDSYWLKALNDGVQKINDAQQAYPEFIKPAENDADKTLKEEAQKKYEAAIVSLTRASLLRPGQPQNMRNLGSVYAFMGDYKTAMTAFQQGLEMAPGDTMLAQSLKTVRTNYANQLIDEKKYDEAVAYFTDLVKAEPGNSDLQLGLASALFSRASTKDGDAKKADYRAAGDAYAKAGELKGNDADLHFNSALSYQKCGDQAKAEVQWRASLKIRPDDPDALSALAETLAELKRFDEAVNVLRQAVLASPKNKLLHRQLGAIYNKAGNNPKSTEELLVFLALHQGQVVDNPAAVAKAAKPGSAAASTFASLGPPDQINRWEGDGQKYETWFYWSKNQALHFGAEGVMASKSDWGSTGTAKK
jgi:tetratricopeptide (TPR) repeat protein